MTTQSEYSLTLCEGETDDTCHVEYRTATEKYTVADDIPDWMGRLFVASPRLLKACESLAGLDRVYDADQEAFCPACEAVWRFTYDGPGHQTSEHIEHGPDCEILKARALVAKAKGEVKT